MLVKCAFVVNIHKPYCFIYGTDFNLTKVYDFVSYIIIKFIWRQFLFCCRQPLQSAGICVENCADFISRHRVVIICIIMNIIMITIIIKNTIITIVIAIIITIIIMDIIIKPSSLSHRNHNHNHLHRHWLRDGEIQYYHITDRKLEKEREGAVTLF